MGEGDLVASLATIVEELRADGSECAPAAEALEAAVNEIEHLETAVERRTVFGQATGLLMARHDLTADQAWHVLSSYSQHTNRKAFEIAAEIVAAHDAQQGEPAGDGSGASAGPTT